AGEEALLLLGVDLLVDEDLAADLPGFQIDQPGAVSGCAWFRHGYLPKFQHGDTERTEEKLSSRRKPGSIIQTPGRLPSWIPALAGMTKPKLRVLRVSVVRRRMSGFCSAAHSGR